MVTADHGADAMVNPMVEDDFETIQAAVSNGVEQGYDMIMILGGSSAGSKDYGCNCTFG